MSHRPLDPDGESEDDSGDSPQSSPRFFIPRDPLTRFIAIYRALDADRGFWEDPTALRFAAITILTSRGEPVELARGVRETADELRQRVGWFSELRSPLRFILSALLLQVGDTPHAFLSEVERVEPMFRAERLRRGQAFEKVAILVLRYASDGQAVRREDITRFKAIYTQMKRYHWWLTGPDDFPVCAMLVHRDGTPEEIGTKIEAIYQGLRHEGFKRGDPLQTAANLLYLTGHDALAVSERMRDLAHSFQTNGLRIRANIYDELAILCFLAQPIQRIVDVVLKYHRTISALRPAPGDSLSLNLASSVAFVHLVGHSSETRALRDTKALISMQTILAAQQSAAVAAAAAAATPGGS